MRLLPGDRIIWIQVLPIDATHRIGRPQPAIFRPTYKGSLELTRRHLEKFGKLESTAFSRTLADGGLQARHWKIQATVVLYGNKAGSEEMDPEVILWAKTSQARLYDVAAPQGFSFPIPVVGRQLFDENGWSLDQICDPPP